MESVLSDRLAALGHPARLAIFRLLVRRHPGPVPAGEVAAALGLRPSTLSPHLATLMQAGLVTRDRAGTSLRYGIAMDTVRATFDALFFDCCRGRPDMCAPAFVSPQRGAAPMPARTYNVLFICTGNSARSIFAESLLRDLGGGRFAAHSAGTRPFSELNPFAVQVLRDKGHDVTPLRAKNVAEFQGPGAPRFDFVFTVCDQAANEECPAWDGQPVSAHWGMPDPVRATGTDAERALAFQHAYGVLQNRIRAFAALPVESLDRIALQRAVDDIARAGDEAPA